MFIKGQAPPNTGRTRFKKGIIPWNKGLNGFNKDYPRSTEWKEKISLGKKNSRKSKLASQMAANNAREYKSDKMSERTKMKISNSNRDKHSGEKSNWWKGGISCVPYPIDWTMTLRRSIRERDKYVCQICNDIQGDTAFVVHHINYDKNDCNVNNLITLCKACHAKTNHKRDYWIKYFKEKYYE